MEKLVSIGITKTEKCSEHESISVHPKVVGYPRISIHTLGKKGIPVAYLGETGAIGAANATLSIETIGNYFETNSGDDFTFNDLICPEDGDITGKLVADGTKAGKLELSCSLHGSISNMLKVFFQSDFTNTDQLINYYGNAGLKWTTSGSALISTATNNEENRALFKNTNGTDYTIKMDTVYFSGGSNGVTGGYGVYYRTTEGTVDPKALSGYCF